MCVRVNQQEECDFGKVTTSFALDYIQDKYESEQASQTNINSEKACVSGTPSLYALINPNLQAGVTDVFNPELYNQGIVRICSTDQPGKGTDAIRWERVGTCDGGRGDVKCWIDRDSVRNVIHSISLEDEALQKINEDAQKYLKEGDFIEDFQGELDKIYELDDDQKIINYINNNNLIGKALFNIEKARLLLIRGNAHSNLAVNLAYKVLVNLVSGDDEKVGDEGASIIFGEDKEETVLPFPIYLDRLTNEVILARLNLYDGIILQASEEYRVFPEELIKAIIIQESTADKNAIGDDGTSFGLMQVSKLATLDVKDGFPNDPDIIDININSFETDILDPKNNVYVGTAYYSLLDDFYSKKGNSGEDLKKISLAAYNWGRGNIQNNCEGDLWINCRNIPQEVLQYVSNILGYEKQLD